MFGLNSSSNASAWKKWIEKRNEARQAYESINVDHARSQHEYAQRGLYALMRELSKVGATVSEPPTEEEIEREASILRGKIAHYQAAGKSEHPSYLAEHRASLDKLKSAQAKVSDTAASLADAEKRKPIARKALEKIEADMPEATPKALATLEGEVSSRQGQIERIDATIASMKDETSNASAIAVEAEQAAAAVDALEADALLGEVSEADKSAAATRLAKARKAAENASQLADKQASASRGLVARKSTLEAEVSELQEIYRGAAFELGKIELARAERDLVKALSEDRLRTLLDAVNNARSEMNSNAPKGTSYSPARLWVKLPIMYEVSSPEHIEC
ncbi:hypothetical protein [Vreelandella alkaliphila]|uniref:Uncharacterized protein n=1 Tax=Vreelandella alkaliphila TaxID=272774 RepID=A0A7C9NPJ8_9GAMM|nr:hypothetical protein [Halomonas alkaliphila]NDL69347.1 hypothetical protein [Halomonas alkaliphila]